MGGVFLVLHIEPLPTPPLDRLSHKEVKVFEFWSNKNDCTTDIIDGGFGGISPNKEDVLPEPQVRMDAKEALVKSDEAGDV